MTISPLGECAELNEYIRRKRLANLSVCREFDEFTMAGFTRTHLRICLLKLGALGEYAE
jgi:hypothetical protein